ncbi:MAG: ATP-binding protein [Desulfosarcinaceae bacterium]|nr:ATP-binding protein [Desulfosarcinaceae bacterium]
MQIRLSFKIMGAFILLTLLTASMILVSVRYFSERNFSRYLREREDRIIANLIPKIEQIYADRGNWDIFQTRPRRWQRFIRLGGRLPRRIQIHGEPEAAAASAERVPASEGAEPAVILGDDLKITSAAGGRSGGRDGSALRETIDLIQLADRLTLFDARQAYISGIPSMPEIEIMHPLEVAGRTVGWVGVDASGALIYPVDKAFMQRQVETLIWVGLIILIVGSALAFGFSRHLTAPIHRLAAASRRLGDRRFDTRIPITNRDDELGQLADAFNAMAANLERYVRRQHQWLRDISHELRTPLAVLLGEIEAVQDGVRPITPEAVASLHAEVSHLIAIVSDLHELARAEADGFTLELAPVLPGRVLMTVLELFEHRLGESGIALACELSPVSNLKVMGDSERLHQLFTNLLHNVLRHAIGADRLTIVGQRLGRRMELCFRDNGPGVPEEALPHLFDRLFRVDPSRSRTTGGSGIGLSVCQTIVEGHGGTISAANAAGPARGLIITVRLPMIPTPAAPFPLPHRRRQR